MSALLRRWGIVFIVVLVGGIVTGFGFLVRSLEELETKRSVFMARQERLCSLHQWLLLGVFPLQTSCGIGQLWCSKAQAKDDGEPFE